MGSSSSLDENKSRKIAIALAFAGVLPLPLPTAWIHKFYLGQYLWGIIYLILFPTGLPKVACCLEGLWYVSQSDEDFSDRFPTARETLSAAAVLAQRSNAQTPFFQAALRTKPKETVANRSSADVASTIRELDRLRQEGLITEYEFELKRRELIEKIK